MKKIILIFIVLFIAGCIETNSQSNEKEFRMTYDLRGNPRCKIRKIDGCEYLVWYYNDVHMIHKGNCRYCLERNAK